MAGASVIAAPMQVANLGTMAVLMDSSGAGFGIWAPIEFQGFAVIDEPRAPRWFEQRSREYDKAVAFYKEVFAWDIREVSEAREPRYTTATHGDRSFAGLMEVEAGPQEVNAHWRVYFGVDDADLAVTTTLELGGSVLSPVRDTPFGRLAALADSTGAIFSIIE